MIPEALETASTPRTMWLFLGGMLGFVALERALRWRHPHQRHADLAHHPELEAATASMILWGDALHNLIDGLVLGVSFSVSLEVGFAASIAVFAHEVPQEIADFSILLASGMPKRRALLLNFLSASTVIPGAAVSYASASLWTAAIAWLLPLAAGGFVYIALANLVPALHHRRGIAAGVIQLALISVGVLTIWGVGAAFHH
jgi:zinc and cadmium transporter